MPKYKILTARQGRWSEGWVAGDIVDLDENAARAAVESGEIMLINEYVEKIVNSPVDIKEEIKLYKCSNCGETHKTKKTEKCNK